MRDEKVPFETLRTDEIFINQVIAESMADVEGTCRTWKGSIDYSSGWENETSTI